MEEILLKIKEYFNEIAIKYKYLKYLRLIFIIVLLVLFCFELEMLGLYLKVFYVILLILAIISSYMYRKDKLNLFFLFAMPIMLVFASVPFKFCSGIALLPLIPCKKRHLFYKVLLALLFLLFLLFQLALFAVSNFGKNTVIYEAYSSDNKYRVDVIDSDQGALGGGTLVKLYRIYPMNSFQHMDKWLYQGPWGEKLKIRWIDNENVIIDETIKVNIYNSPTYDKKERAN